MAKVAKLFNSPEGKDVLTLLCRRFGVLGRRFQGGAGGEVLAAIKDGEAGSVLFILQCMKASGVASITLDL